ncbi:MAG: TraK family protein [Desulfovibrionales bacterium]|nr:TraK family protein [Desulfovibrionales bacterium]
MSSDKRLRRRMAYVEYLACADEIASLVAQGFSKKMIYEQLTEKGRISMAYVTLCQIMQKNAQEYRPKPEDAKHSLKNSGPRIVHANHDPFPDPRKMNLEDGI